MSGALLGSRTVEYGMYRIHFPEEDVYINLTSRLSTEVTIALENAAKKGKKTIVNDAITYMHPRAITERLLRRIVAKLLRVS